MEVQVLQGEDLGRLFQTTEKQLRVVCFNLKFSDVSSREQKRWVYF